MSSAKEGAQGFFDLTHGNEFNLELLLVETREVVFGNDDVLET